ncbi:diguanylate cyclase/phosphodiesterase with PAS/PAC sensor [Pseudanabaena sp. lw0831]|uniref:GAF domain-containing protein n=1 Tax=Pseudanabaena sp. lw0831 TaxID=1357935 RepID=UPI0019169AA2|nr:GAF domain-containing protein [Pseudanabaena sp. lw0831]GBO54057.1 diguanylate cyclase/phosphodiesterase with PAS/PAC sensor [Pseudanabaena sp. lw0831]
MNGASTFFDPSDKIESGSIALAMFSSNSPEELLKIFLTSLGDRLAVSRVAIYQLTNQDEGIVLVEAVSPNIQNIKNQTYPISCFGVDSLLNYRRNRPVVLSDITQISELINLHQCWQNAKVKAMMSAPILFNSLTAFDKIWGLAFVQQCDRTRQWEPQEAYFLFELSQFLGQCLQSWELSLRSPTFSKSLLLDDRLWDESPDQEEFVVKRVKLSKDLKVKPDHPNPITDGIAVSKDFILSDDDANEILDRSLIKNSETSINQAINLAMQRLDRKIQYSSSSYPRDFSQTDASQDIYGVDLESITIEDVLESCAQEATPDQTQSKVNYLQQRVGELVESMQLKLDEIALLQKQVQELTASQQEFRQILLDLQSENLTQSIRDTVIEMYRSLS